MKIEMLAPGKIKRYTNNPRLNDHAVDVVLASLKEFGWRQPIVVDKHMVIVVGDTRYLAALKRKDKLIPVHIATDLSEAQIKAYRIADNKTGEHSDWDGARLMQELNDLLLMKFDMKTLGFHAGELDAILNPETPKRELEDFSVSPSATDQWLVIHGAEDDCAVILAAIKKLKLKNIHLEYSNDPGYKGVTHGG